MSTTRCAVLGSPIGHSLSPVLHRAAYAALGLATGPTRRSRSARQGWPTSSTASTRRWRGLSLTMPLKRTVLPLVDSLDDRPRLAGAANTVLLGDGRRLGDNTDIPGAAAAHPGAVRRAGAHGGRARRRSHGDLGRAGARRARLPSASRCWCATPSAPTETVAASWPTTSDRRARGPARSRGAARGRHRGLDDPGAGADTRACSRACAGVPVVFDVVYDPWPTPAGALGRPPAAPWSRAGPARPPGGAAGAADDRPRESRSSDARRRRAGDHRRSSG